MSKESTKLWLVKQIRDLLNGFEYNNNGLFFNGILIKKQNQEDVLYERYKNPIKKFKELDIDVEELLPYAQSFNEKRFWFIDDNPKIKLENGQRLVTQDGQSIIVNEGEFLNGGLLKNEHINKAQNTIGNEKIVINSFVYIYKNKKIERPKNNLYVMVEGEYAVKIYNKPMIRFYFNLLPDIHAIIKLTNFLEVTLNKYRIPFSLKYPLNLSNYNFSDSAVLYTAQNHFPIVSQIIKDFFQKFENFGGLGSSVPLFTKRLYSGIGFAEDPFFTKESFGEHRCNLIFGIIKDENLILNSSNIDDTINIIYGKLIEKKYSNDFFRNPYTNFRYNFDLFEIKQTKAQIKNLRSKFISRAKEIAEDFIKNSIIDDEVNKIYNVGKMKYREYKRILNLYSFLDIAENYGKDLIEKAIWNPEKDCYNWLTYDKPSKYISYYRLANNEELVLIRYFLVKLAEISKDNYYENIGLKIKISNTEKRDSENKQNNSKNKDLVEILSKFIETKPKQVEILDEIQTLISGISNLNEIDEKKIKELARIVERYFEKINLPMKNDFGNYEFCPTLKGKLKIALLFLIASRPDSFNEITKEETNDNDQGAKLKSILSKMGTLAELINRWDLSDN